MSQYAATSAFVGTLLGHGLRHAVVSPGLRSVPLSLTVDAAPGLVTTVAHDERVGGFTALGIARASGRPVLVVCTSGSALANLFPAIVEAHHTRVPLIVATGDRPPELHGWDSPQTIEQRNIYGSFARSIELPVGEETTREEAAAAAHRAWQAAAGVPAGPIHVNWPFREPLEPSGVIDVTVSVPPPATQAAATTTGVDQELVGRISGSSNGLIAAGELGRSEREAVLALARATGWPVLADPLSGLRTPADAGLVVTTMDHLLATRWADDHIPEVIVRAGSAPTSKSLRLWMERVRAKNVVVVDPAAQRRDPSRTMTDLVAADLGQFSTAVIDHGTRPDAGWGRAWAHANSTAVEVVRSVAGQSFEEAAATRTTAEMLDETAIWHVASSTPIRDVDWYVDAVAAEVTSNRGANGIDGTVATATGEAIGSERPVVVTVGDVAAVHDAGGLLAAATTSRPPVVVVYANGGGGIFSLLPIARATDPTSFERVLHTPVDVDFEALAAAARFAHRRVADADGLREALAAGLAGERSFIEVVVSVEGSRRQLQEVRSRIASSL